MIFDLWDTLVDWRPTAIDRMADRLGRDRAEFWAAWDASRTRRDGGEALELSLRALGADEELVPELVAIRREATREALVPRPGALDTLEELSRRGLQLGMISVCSEEVPELWGETAFAGRFDSLVFSCSVGLRKPDPRIYRLCLDELGVEARDALFVGDGANDELAGAERVGMRAVLIHRRGQAPIWPEARSWDLRITSIPEVLDLC